MTEIIIVCILIEFILVVLRPRYNDYVVYLVPFIYLFIDVFVLKNIHRAKLVNTIEILF